MLRLTLLAYFTQYKGRHLPCQAESHTEGQIFFRAYTGVVDFRIFDY